MTQKLVNGELVDLTPEEQQEHDERNTPQAAINQKEAMADANVEMVFGVEADPAFKAFGLVLADLAVAAGVAPNVALARQEVRSRWRTYYRNQLDGE